MHATLPLLKTTNFPAINRSKLTTLQVNLGYKCNQTCLHCHVNAGPKRTEAMDKKTIGILLDFIERQNIKTLDLTGGAPELNQHFLYLVSSARKLGVKVIDRCNLTILEEPGQNDLAQFLADHQVEIVASLPCYLEENVDGQRGKGVFQSSMNGLKKLNQLGYGKDASGLTLNLVYNPTGAYLPPPQEQLEKDYKKELKQRFDIDFNHLFSITNMPIARFGSTLISKGEFGTYMNLLHDAYSENNLETVMCKDLISIDWQGYVYDCDFNQMLNLPLINQGKPKQHLSDLLDSDLENNPIVIADHCYGCTAGQGSSCSGALT